MRALELAAVDMDVTIWLYLLVQHPVAAAVDNISLSSPSNSHQHQQNPRQSNPQAVPTLWQCLSVVLHPAADYGGCRF